MSTLSFPNLAASNRNMFSHIAHLFSALPHNIILCSHMLFAPVGYQNKDEIQKIHKESRKKHKIANIGETHMGRIRKQLLVDSIDILTHRGSHTRNRCV